MFWRKIWKTNKIKCYYLGITSTKNSEKFPVCSPSKQWIKYYFKWRYIMCIVLKFLDWFGSSFLSCGGTHCCSHRASIHHTIFCNISNKVLRVETLHRSWKWSPSSSVFLAYFEALKRYREAGARNCICIIWTSYSFKIAFKYWH